jgi:hypothetical protein
MKAINKFFTLIAIALFMITTTVFAGGLEFEEEDYINDIPFSTAKIYNEMMFNEIEFSFEEEAYVDDIPFAMDVVLERLAIEESLAVEFNFEEEKYINDIPFSTQKLSQQIQLRNHMCQISKCNH